MTGKAFGNMCGICGFVNRGGVEDGGLLLRMTHEIRHRGPDETGFFSTAEVGFGHTRLSIIDHEGGRQPMCTPDRRLWITFNGEIFNFVELRAELIGRGHQFRTRSDTEVILHLYLEEGEECVNRLNGQWAFAIWDAAERKLFLSRDRLGVRPLFYAQMANRFLFGSEVKALLASDEVPRELDLETLDQIFTFWAPLPPRTAFRNIRQLPPGHSLILKAGCVRTWQYWRLEYGDEAGFASEKEDAIAEKCLDLIMDATRVRLRSDVPVGAYLSGGLDSTLIAARARKVAGEPLHTFSLAFEDPEFDESVYQREASSMIGTEHSAVECRGADIARVFPEVIRYTEQPILRTAPAPLYLLAQQVRQNGFKVVLTGEGADELFGGYDIFQETKVRRFWARDLDSRMRPRLLKRLYPYLPDLQLCGNDGYAEEMLSPARVKRDGIFEPNAVSALVKKFRSGRTCGTKDNMALDRDLIDRNPARPIYEDANHFRFAQRGQ